MYGSRIILGILAFVALIIISLVLIFGGHGKKSTPPTGPTVNPLPDYANTTAEVSLTTDGTINGDELHRAIRITIAQGSRHMDVLQGYSGQVIQSKDFYNTQDAYTVFLKAINNAGFTSKVKNSKLSSDERGQCPTGFRYILELSQDGSDLSRTWTSTCGIGTSGGDIGILQSLFQHQIPGYETLTNSVNLSLTDVPKQ